MKQTVTITADSKMTATLKKMVALKKENREIVVAKLRLQKNK